MGEQLSRSAGTGFASRTAGQTVLIIGERGTGKELIASRLHFSPPVGKGRLFPLIARR